MNGWPDGKRKETFFTSFIHSQAKAFWFLLVSSLTVGLQSPRLAAPAPRLVDGLDDKDVLGAALQAVHCVVVLLDVGNDHPALQ